MTNPQIDIAKNPAPKRAGFFAFGSCLVLAATAACTRKSENYTQRVIVQVNAQSMTAGQFADDLVDRLKEFDALTVKDQAVLNRAKEDVIRSFVIKVITQDWAKEQKIFVRREDLDDHVNKIRSYYPDDLAFRRALADEGMTFEEWREKVKFSLLQKLVTVQINKDLKEPEQKELKDYYENHKDEFKSGEQVRLRQIVMDSENNAKRIADELKAGKSLEELARKYSIAPEAANGGDIGWIEKGTLDIFDQAFTMKAGQRSRILKSPYGYHIYEVTARRPARTIPWDEVKDRIQRTLIGKREQAGYAAWLEKQVQKAKVFKDEELIAKIHAQTRSE